MIDIVVLDTSVVIKWFRQEEILADRALALRDAYLSGQSAFSMPSLLVYELANVLRYKADLTTDQISQALQSLYDMGLSLVPPSATLMRRTVDIARHSGATAYDAAFAALAESLGATFITADESLSRKLEGLCLVRYLGAPQAVEP